MSSMLPTLIDSININYTESDAVWKQKVFLEVVVERQSQAEVGRVPKNCTQVKVNVLVEIFTQVKVKVNVWIVTWVRVKKYRIKKTTQVVSYYLFWIIYWI